MDAEVDVVIVGAGLAGLCAARSLVSQGASVRVLEARDRVGGRTKGGVIAGVPIEVGGQWVGPAQTEVLGLIDELGLETFRTHDLGDALMHVDGSVVRYADGSYGLDEGTLMEVGGVLAAIDELAASVDLDAPWMTELAAEYDSQTLDTWFRQQTSDPTALRFLRLLVPAIFSAESAELSLLHFLFYVRSGNTLGELVATTHGAQERRIVGGSHRISEELARGLGKAVSLSSPVRSVTQHADGVTACYDGGSVTAKYALVALPPTLAGRLRYEPALPAHRDALTQQIPAGSVIKINVAYERPFWRDQGLSGSALSLDAPFNVVLDNSPPDGAVGVLVGFLEGRHARELAERTADERRAVVLDTLVTLFGPEAGSPVEIVEQDWMAEEFTRGCYGGRMAPGVWTQYGAALTRPCGRIHWASAETASVGSGYMEGAIRAGRAAAGTILKELTSAGEHSQ